ncbi:lipocalin family protein [Capnocytophaga canimorsus]|uniref:Lipocalin-like domain-containing protein n=1 Tax=Capnocytophaga canimorsus TaxID=28188 RepID=A0AAC9Z3L2_9FLAO|nr:lipocalin family protein [Capnocytophaga canimorsus]ATA93821.1 hypothetical protein CGC54_05440 [Capnocytophaga canimorsus]
MKKVLNFVVAILAISLYSCGKDDKKNDAPNPFIGTWKLDQYIDRGVDKTNDCNQKSTIVFTENMIIINSHYTDRTNSCIPETIEYNYKYTDGKISSIMVVKSGRLLDDITEFIIENKILTFVRIVDKSQGLKQIERYKKQ